MTKSFVVVGGGPIGVEAGVLAARHGSDVTLASESEVGGRATWDSLVPSKVLLAAAGMVRGICSAAGAGVTAGTPHVSVSLVIARIRHLSADASASDRERLEQAGVRLVRGFARFLAAGRLRVEAEVALLPVAAAIAGGLDVGRFATLAPAYPTIGEITVEAARRLA